MTGPGTEYDGITENASQFVHFWFQTKGYHLLLWRGAPKELAAKLEEFASQCEAWQAQCALSCSQSEAWRLQSESWKNSYFNGSTSEKFSVETLRARMKADGVADNIKEQAIALLTSRLVNHTSSEPIVQVLIRGMNARFGSQGKWSCVRGPGLDWSLAGGTVRESLSFAFDNNYRILLFRGNYN